jgi:hypothetical protein
MRFTPQNYIEQSCRIPLSQLPTTLVRGHQIAIKAFADDMQAYQKNKIVRSTMDHYLDALNEHVGTLSKMKVVKPTSKKKMTEAKSAKMSPAKMVTKPNVDIRKASKYSKKWVVWNLDLDQKFANEKFDSKAEALAFITQNKLKAVAPQSVKKKTPSAVTKVVTRRKISETKLVEKIPDEIRFIQRYVQMHGRVRSRLVVNRLLSSLQKAMLEKRIRKTSVYAKEILQIQDQLIKCLNRMGDKAEISIAKKYLSGYKEIASSARIRESVALLKRFVRLHGRENVQEKAAKLVGDMELMVNTGKVTKKDPFVISLNDAYKSLKTYLKEDKGSPKIQAETLNGIHELIGVKQASVKQKSNKGLSGVVSSETLMKMDFETIGLQGRFRELIGDPAVGFTAMVFGQPKSGKSTLMLEFAHYLAQHHDNALYVAFEEGYGYTLKEKITRIGAIHPNLHFAEKLPKNLQNYGFVFIDSVSRAGMELADMIKLKNKYPKTSFIFIFHATKDGKFKGGNELAHEVDAIIEVENGLAKGKGRFGQGEIEVRF